MHYCRKNVPDYMISGSRGDYPVAGGIHFSYNSNEELHGALPYFREATTVFS